MQISYTHQEIINLLENRIRKLEIDLAAIKYIRKSQNENNRQDTQNSSAKTALPSNA
jgi:hypothetical protein